MKMMISSRARKPVSRVIPETEIQISIVQWLRVVLPDALTCHFANGGYRTPREAAKFKDMGVVAGMPDLMVLTAGYGALFFEVKGAKGAPSDAQNEIHYFLNKNCYPIAVVRGIDDVRAALAEWKIPTREARK